MHCANMSYMYHCLLLSKEVRNIKKVCARSLLVKLRLQVKMNLAFAILYLNLVMETLHVHTCHNDVRWYKILGIHFA